MGDHLGVNPFFHDMDFDVYRMGMFWISQWIDLYPGFDLSKWGTLIGLIYGFIHGFISLFIFGCLYNALRPEKKEKKERVKA